MHNISKCLIVHCCLPYGVYSVKVIMYESTVKTCEMITNDVVANKAWP